jgi:uncharacterized protein (TIGR03437 family)
MSAPGGLAVDANGNLYIVDTGNNRVLRYPKPLSVADDLRVPDLVVGQPNFNSGTANNGGISERTLSFSSSSAIGRTALAFDAAGNLWLTDALNNRVIRYPASALAAGTNQPAADVVLGQPAFTLNTPAGSGAADRLNKAALRGPGGIAIDERGRVYVSDSLARVLVYEPTFPNGKEATRVLGLSARPPAQQTVGEYLLGAPEGLAMVGNRLAVADPGFNRITIYDPYTEWPAETEELPSPAARQVIGQTGFRNVLPNRGLAEPSQTTLNGPIGIHFSGGELFVADTGNHRVLVFPQQASGASASRVLGQAGFNLNGANRVEGNELYLFSRYTDAAGQPLSDGAGIAIDTTSSQPRLYIADTFNNRVLGYADARKVRAGDRADIVIGQNDLNRVLINAPFGDRENLSDSGLFRPAGLAVDKNGDLFVADAGNSRVLRFPSPFTQQVGANDRRRANLVLGQLAFNQRILDATPRNMAFPFGLAFTIEGNLVVSDAAHSRLLYFRRPENGDFTNGQAAEKVMGQPDFFSVGRGNAQNRMSSPRHLAIDTDGRLYAVDAGNNRVLIYDNINIAGNDPNPAFILTGLNGPHGVFVSPITGEIWVANSKANTATRFPRYDRVVLEGRSDYSIPSAAPLALTQDQFGNLYIAEGVNRIAIFYNALAYTVAGNYSIRALSPGTIANLYPAGAGVQFSDASTAFDQLPNPLPVPIDITDVQVLVNDKPAPIYFVSPFQINFLVPMSAPDSGTGEIQVIKPSTGQVIGARTVNFDKVSPALFVASGGAEGQLAALNQDNSVNSAATPIPRGQVIQLFGTGQGFVPNAPPDGTPPSGPVPIQEGPLRVVIGTDFVPDANIEYSGLAPGLVGVWQINVKVPETVAPGAAVPVALQLRNVPSTIPDPTSSRRLNTTIAVSQ